MQVFFLKEAASTNELARKYPAGSVIAAKIQTKGRGRFNRAWESGEGGLWFSIVLSPKRKFCEYTFIAALAVQDALANKEVSIKWPNDLLAKGKKLCGILTEIFSEGNNPEKVIVGIGLNVNNTPPPEGISLKMLTGRQRDIRKLLDLICMFFDKYAELDLSTILRRYRQRCVTLGRVVHVRSLDKEVTGKAIDIDDEGNLLVQTESSLYRFTEGETTLR